MGRAIVLFAILLLGGFLAGCGELDEFYVFAQPIYPSNLDPNEKRELQITEVQRREYESKEYPNQYRNDQYSGMGLYILTARFREPYEPSLTSGD